MWWVGLILVAGGLIVLGWVAWQFWGTNWVSERRQGEVASALKQGWSADQDTVTTEFGETNAILSVPRFGKSYAMPILEEGERTGAGGANPLAEEAFPHATP